MNEQLRAPLPALRLAVLALLIAGASWWVAPTSALGLATPLAPAASLQDDPLPEGKFREEVRKAAAIGDQQAVATLMRNNPRNTVAWIIITNEMFSDAPNEALSKDMNLLRTGWRSAFSTGFFDKVEAFFAGLRPEFRRTRNEHRNRFNELQSAFDRILAEKASEERTLRARELSERFESLGGAFRDIGDRYYSSNAFGNAGYLVDSTMVGDQSDPVRAHTLLKLALEERLQLELEDRILRNLRIDVARLEPYAVPPAGAPDDGGGDTTSKLPGVAVGPLTTVAGTFEPVPSIGTFERLGYSLDDVYMAWPNLFLSGETGSASFGGMQKDGPTVRRTGAAAAEVVGTDGSIAPLPITGNVELVQTVIGSEENRRPWAFLMTVPSDKEQYQGFELNYQPTQTQMVLPVAPAASMVFDVAGTRVRILDENMDGIYGGPESTWTYPGLVEGEFQVDVDSVVVGASKRAVPFSELMQIGNAWYRLESQDGGKNLNVESATLRTGKVKLEMKGLSPHSVIVRGTGALAGCYFDLMATKGTAELPIGTYQLVQGVVREGRRLNVRKCLFLGSGRAIFSVQEGKTTAFGLGAPFDISFKADVDQTTATIRGASLTVTGQGGERYHRLWGYTLRPEVSFRKAGVKRASRPERMPLVLDQSTVIEKGMPIAWYPLDMTIEHGLGSDEVEFQFTEKKHALFGKLESTWK